MASVEAIGEPGARRRPRGGSRGSGRREGAKSMRVPSFCNCIQVGEDGWGCPVGWQWGGQAELTRTTAVCWDELREAGRENGLAGFGTARQDGLLGCGA